MSWRKHAILGSTYARALRNAAGRAGRSIEGMGPALSSIEQQPLAKLKPGLSSFVREPGAVAPTPQQHEMQQMLAHVPWAGPEHGGSPFAESTLNAQLRQRGLDYRTPAGQPNTHQRILGAFGPSDQAARGGITSLGYQDPKFRPSPNVRPGAHTQIGHLSPTEDPRGDVFDLWEGAPEGGWRHLPELTRIGTGPQRRMRPPPMQRPVVSQGPSDATNVLKFGAALPALAGVGIPLAVGGGLLATKPGIQANVRALREGGSTQERDVAEALPEAAVHQANAIRDALVAHGLDPATARMGIDAPPGSGKTTLARALAQQAGMKHYGLDWEPGNWWKSTIGLGRNVEHMPRAPKAGEVLEHYMLGRTYDPELFDAMVHIHRDPEVLKQQLQHRGHGAYIGDLMDLQKSLGVADLGFNTLGGDVIDLGNGVQMKLRPREGWGDALDQRLMQAGIDPTGLSRHDKLLSLYGGRRETGAGWTPYVKSPFSGAEAAAIGASIPLGVMAAKALARRPR